MRTASGFALVLLATLGCSPALDWRDVRPEGAGLTLLFPCKPAAHSRQVRLAEHPVRLNLQACSADGATWAVAFVDVGDPRRVGPALRELHRAAADNLGAAPGALQPWPVPGETPQPDSGRAILRGKTPQGEAMVSRAVFFARGMQVYQATVMGGEPSAQALEQFFGSLRLSAP